MQQKNEFHSKIHTPRNKNSKKLTNVCSMGAQHLQLLTMIFATLKQHLHYRLRIIQSHLACAFMQHKKSGYTDHVLEHRRLRRIGLTSEESSS
jgi:hypothetical protein